MTSKILPWLVSLVLLVLLAATWRDSQLTLAQKDAELQSAKQQYDQLVKEANSKIKALTDEANQKIQLANQPEISVRVSFRKAMLSSGNVAGFSNTSGQTIAILATVERASSSQSRNFELTIDPGQVKEIGEREGWAFIPGDTITISQPEHKSLSVQAP